MSKVARQLQRVRESAPHIERVRPPPLRVALFGGLAGTVLAGGLLGGLLEGLRLPPLVVPGVALLAMVLGVAVALWWTAPRRSPAVRTLEEQLGGRGLRWRVVPLESCVRAVWLEPRTGRVPRMMVDLVQRAVVLRVRWSYLDAEFPVALPAEPLALTAWLVRQLDGPDALWAARWSAERRARLAGPEWAGWRLGRYGLELHLQRISGWEARLGAGIELAVEALSGWLPEEGQEPADLHRLEQDPVEEVRRAAARARARWERAEGGRMEGGLAMQTTGKGALSEA